MIAKTVLEESGNGLNYLYRITRDITDGLIVIDLKGTVVYINPSAKNILNNPALAEGAKYADFMASDNVTANDGFHQYVLDCIYDKNAEHIGLVNYTCPDGSRYILRVISSYEYNDEKTENIGVILQFSDVTEKHLAQQKQTETAVVLVALLAMLSIWNLVYGIWEYAAKPIPPHIMTMLVELMGAEGAVYILRKTSITKKDLGLHFRGTRRYVLQDGLYTLIILVAMIIAKLIMRMKGMPAGSGPMFYFSAWSITDTIYPLTVVIQEFLTRGVVQGSVARILPWKNRVAISIILSSLFFSALHIHLGLGFMTGSFLLLSVFGIIYQKQKTIWGLCIPHYFLGLSLKLIWGIGI